MVGKTSPVKRIASMAKWFPSGGSSRRVLVPRRQLASLDVEPIAEREVSFIEATSPIPDIGIAETMPKAVATTVA